MKNIYFIVTLDKENLQILEDKSKEYSAFLP